jgi:uncharacterized protein (DUF2164 family)
MQKIVLGKEARKDLIEGIKNFFLKERGEELSDFQAAIVLDFFLDSVAPAVYNQAIADAHSLMAGMIEEIYGLEKRPR